MSAQAQRDWPSGVRIRRGLVRVAPTVLAKIFLTVFLGQFAVVLFLDWLDLDWGLGSGLLATLLLTLLIVAPLYFGVFRSLAAQAARASTSAGEAKYRGLLEAAPDGVVVIDRKGRMVLVNAQAEKMFGYSREEMLGQPIELLVPQRFHEPHVQHHATYFSKPGTRPMGAGQDLLGRRKDGSEFSVDISLSPFQAEEGLLVTSIVRDTTERRRAEREMVRLAAFANLSPHPVLECDAKGRILYANPAANRLLSIEGTANLDLRLFFPAFPQLVQRCLEGNAEIQGEETQVGAQTFLWSLRPVPEAARVHIHATDITEHKRAEEELQRSAERFRQILEALPVAIRVMQDGIVVFCNSADVALHGFESTEEIIGVDAFLYFEEEDAQRLWEHGSRRVAGDPTVPNRCEAHVKRCDGRAVPVEVVSTRILYAGRPASLTVLLDLSERKRLQLYESILPVCCVCGKVRDDTGTEQGKGAWESLQAFVMEHSDTNLSHTFCPPCYQEYRQQQGLPPEEP